jgi:hypothetical protein
VSLQICLANAQGYQMKEEEEPLLRMRHRGRQETPISARHGSLGGAASDQRKSSGMRRLSDESVNRSSRQSARNRAMDANFLDALHINTPTPENVGNPSHQQNMFGKFLLFLYFFVYLCLCFICFFFFFFFFMFFVFLLNVVISFKCVFV